MTHKTGEHLEHAEHAKHASHARFDTTVTMTIAIIAAVLAAITMLGHRAHNETLVSQGQALVSQTESAIQHDKANDNWAWYQALRIRTTQEETAVEMSELTLFKPGEETEKKLITYREKWKSNAIKHNKESKEVKEKAEDFDHKGEEKLSEARKYLATSHEIHVKAIRFDYGEVGLELGIVLCSLAILLKSRSFWLTGLLCAIVGVCVAVTGEMNLFMDTHHDAAHEEHKSGETEKAKPSTAEEPKPNAPHGH
jgi:hypothetical protein